LILRVDAVLISQRMRAALAIAKARGARLGNPFLVPATPARAAAARAARSRQVAERAADLVTVVRVVQAEGASSLRAIAAELHARGVLTPAGKPQWSPEQVRRLLVRTGMPA
jgi:DNA invertase Pin-like site-specific DNA recombinase